MTGSAETTDQHLQQLRRFELERPSQLNKHRHRRLPFTALEQANVGLPDPRSRSERSGRQSQLLAPLT
jgi:hypothetical protein